MDRCSVTAARTKPAGGRRGCWRTVAEHPPAAAATATDMDYFISLLLVLPCVRASAYRSGPSHEGRASAYQSGPSHGERASSHQNASPVGFASVYPSAASPLRLASVYPSAAGHLRLANIYPSAASHLGFGRLVQLRGNADAVYASDSSGEEYEPYAVAALPLHPPVPILQVLSPSAHRTAPRRPAKRPRPRPESADLYAFDTTHGDRAYEPVEYERVYDSSESSEESQPKRSKARDQYEDAESSVVMYARPNRHGGFSYRKPAAPARAAAAAPARAHEPQEPVIIRIHKYRVIH